MISINIDKCNGCAICSKNCPVEALRLEKGKVVVSNNCVRCSLCSRICPTGAISILEATPSGSVKCNHCPVECQIREGFTGACRRYRNVNGKLLLVSPLIIPRRKKIDVEKIQEEFAVSQPLITAIGAGTTYPDKLPAPYVVEDEVEGVDVVTVASESPLSYSGMLVKIDTDHTIGEEGDKVKRDGVEVGMVIMEQYGSKMLQIGGVNTLTGKKLGVVAARTIVDLVKGKEVELQIRNHSLLIRIGKPPIIDGKLDEKMRVGCGAATIGMFGDILKEVADEVIVLDRHITAVLSEHPIADILGLKFQGIIPLGRKSTRGRYFGTSGEGWGGTNITNPEQAIAFIDKNRAKPGIKILVIETTGKKGAMFQLEEDWTLKSIDLTPKALEAIRLIANNCEPARVSALLIGGLGGSARAGVTKYPIKLTKAVHNGWVKLTIGGAPTYILPGGGITFIVDVEKILKRNFTWTPTPAIVVPVEYTMKREIYEVIEGHIEALKPLSKALEERNVEQVG